MKTKKRVHHSRRQVRNERGVFVKKITTRPAATSHDMVESMRVLHEWRDARQEYAQRLKAAKHEERWGGLRSILMLTVMASVMVGLLVIGVMAT